MVKKNVIRNNGRVGKQKRESWWKWNRYQETVKHGNNELGINKNPSYSTSEGLMVHVLEEKEYEEE